METVLSGEEIKLSSSIAHFIANVTTGHVPLSVLFTDLSQNVTSRSWDFNNDGTIDSTEANPVYVFKDPGNYTVNMTVTNEKGTAYKLMSIDVQTENSGGGSSSGGSSSGGGSGGGSPEPANNVEARELSQAFVTNGREARFEFPRNATCVISVSFNAKKTFGKTTTIAEMLKEKSSLVTELPAGETYKSFNVWVGNGGVATPKNIENPEIGFKVEKSWPQNNSIDPASITLNRYADKIWEQFPVFMAGEDSNYLYFTANVSGYSSFTITGNVKSASENQKAPEIQEFPKNQKDNQSSAGSAGLTYGLNNSTIKSETQKSTPGFETGFVVACLFCLYLHKRK
jgi:PGF-pre-PGF domain-containing protein